MKFSVRSLFDEMSNTKVCARILTVKLLLINLLVIDWLINIYSCVMLRGPRGSNSVAARIVRDERDICMLTDSAEEDGADGETVVKFKEQLPRKPKRRRRVVRVLDLAESSRCGSQKFLHFAERLHPWNTIKVSCPLHHWRVLNNWRLNALICGPQNLIDSTNFWISWIPLPVSDLFCLRNPEASDYDTILHWHKSFNSSKAEKWSGNPLNPMIFFSLWRTCFLF